MYIMHRLLRWSRTKQIVFHTHLYQMKQSPQKWGPIQKSHQLVVLDRKAINLSWWQSTNGLWHVNTNDWLALILSTVPFTNCGRRRNYIPFFCDACVISTHSRFSFDYSDIIISAMVSQIISLTIYSGTDERKAQSSASLAFVRGIHQWPVNSPYKGPVMRLFPFDDVIMSPAFNLITWFERYNFQMCNNHFTYPSRAFMQMAQDPTDDRSISVWVLNKCHQTMSHSLN